MIVDIVIPTHDAKALVLECVARLGRRDPRHRVIVVDDASTDGTAEAIGKRYPGVEVVRLEEQRGLAHALNRGSAAGTAELVLFLNNDVFAEPSALERLAEALRADQAASCAGGRLVDPGTTTTQLAYQPRPLPGLAALLVRLLGIERLWPRNPWTGRYLTEPLDAAGTQRTNRQPAGACLMVRRRVLERIRGWDERYSLWYEDVDLARRLATIGPALYVPGAVFEHIGAASTRAWRKHEQRLLLYHGTMVYAQAHLSRIKQATVAVTMIVICGARSVVGRRDALLAYRTLLGQALRMVRFREVGR